MKTAVLPADVRRTIVSQLGKALAAAWQREYSHRNDERPERLIHAAGRDVHGGTREHDEPITSTT